MGAGVIGVTTAYYLAKQIGWKVIYLGVRVPAVDLLSILHYTKAKLLFSTFTIANPSQQEKLIEIIQKNEQTTLLLSGNKAIFEEVLEHERIIYLQNPSELVDFLKNY